MDDKQTKKYLEQEIGKYEKHLSKIKTAFEDACKKIHETYKPKVEKALLAEDEQYATELVQEQNTKMQSLLADLKKSVDQNGKKFLTYLEGYINTIERESKLAELKKELDTL